MLLHKFIDGSANSEMKGTSTRSCDYPGRKVRLFDQNRGHLGPDGSAIALLANPLDQTLTDMHAYLLSIYLHGCRKAKKMEM